MLFTSGIMDDFKFLYRGANGPESSSPTLCLEELCQVAVPVGRQTATVFGSLECSTGGKVCYLRLPCCNCK